MNGELAQLVALTCHGNAFLGGAKPAQPFYPGNSTCQFCQPLRFVNKEVVVAQSPDDWFAHLRSMGALGIQLLHQASDDPKLPDHQRAAFVGGGGNWLAMRRAGGVDFWGARWEVGDRNAKDDRIWKVTYGLVASGGAIAAAKSLATAHAELEAALQRIHTFAAAQGVQNFAQIFARALQALNGAGGHQEFHGDLFVAEALSPLAKRLLAASQQAWVFGGMGSWNDLGFEGAADAEYDRVTSALYSAVLEATIAAANESDRAAG